jgi:heat shock protein HtpX
VKFISRSLLVLLLLYGLVFAVADAYLVHVSAPLWTIIAFPVVWVGIQYLIGPWVIRLILDIYWDEDLSQLPARNREFIEKLCAERRMKVPKIGIIQSGTPNAFSFGRLRSDACVVVTSGLLDILTPEESNAVLAHEIGHIEHWDFAIMTLAALAPMVLYQIYIVTERINNIRAIAYGAYLCYLLSQFIVLLLNRTREYFADHYAAEVTQAPDDLSSALVKIAYGMIRQDGEYKKAREQGSKDEKEYWNRERRLGGALALMGISNLRSGQSLAVAANPADAAAVMRWDLTNPWARFYELNSTHPLTALRVRELSREALKLNQVSRYGLPEDQPVRWGSFPLQLLIWAGSFLCIAALLTIWWFPGAFSYVGISLSPATQPLLLVLAGGMWLLRVAYRYHGKFEDARIGALLEDTEVSQMRPRAVRLRGKIRGRGEPGAFWSPDLLLRDDTGMIFLMYRQSIPFARFLFGVSEAESYVGQEVVVEGWFRRGLMPYVELSKLTGENNRSHHLISRWVQCAAAIAAIIIGLIWLR